MTNFDYETHAHHLLS